jgi:hypothetical protein
VDDFLSKEFPKIALAFVLGLAGSALGVGLISWRDIALTSQSLGELERRVDANEATIRTFVVDVTRNTLYRLQDEKHVDEIKGKIDAIRESVSELKSNAGTEGRELERRIHQLEHPDGRK